VRRKMQTPWSSPKRSREEALETHSLFLNVHSSGKQRRPTVLSR
jgi:hypothetical protein